MNAMLDVNRPLACARRREIARLMCVHLANKPDVCPRAKRHDDYWGNCGVCPALSDSAGHPFCRLEAVAELPANHVLRYEVRANILRAAHEWLNSYGRKT